MSKYIMAKAYAHRGLTEMRRVDEEEYDIASIEHVVNHPLLGRCYVGSWVCGVGTFHVHFPDDAVRLATRDEIDRFTKGKFGSNFGYSYKAKEEDFATFTDLDQMPVDPNWERYS